MGTVPKSTNHIILTYFVYCGMSIYSARDLLCGFGTQIKWNPQQTVLSKLVSVMSCIVVCKCFAHKNTELLRFMDGTLLLETKCLFVSFLGACTLHIARLLSFYSLYASGARSIM